MLQIQDSDTKYLQKVSDSDLNLNEHWVKNSLPPVGERDLTTKKYVDDLSNKKLDKIILNDINLNRVQLTNLGNIISNNGDVINLGYANQYFLWKVITGDIDLDDHRIRNSLEPLNSKDLTTKNYVDTEIAKIPQGSSGDTSSFLKIDGTRAMTGDLNMDTNKIINLKTPTNDSDATNKNYVDQKIEQSHFIFKRNE